jgi:signal transduction histidine kinase
VVRPVGVVAFYVLAAFARRVQEAHEETARLLAELAASRRSQEEAAALSERSRIAREIHDVLAHSLSGLMLQLEGARMLAARPSSNGELPAALERAHHLAHAGLEEARRAIGALHDEELPGVERLDQLATRACQRPCA